MKTQYKTVEIRVEYRYSQIVAKQINEGETPTNSSIITDGPSQTTSTPGLIRVGPTPRLCQSMLITQRAEGEERGGRQD